MWIHYCTLKLSTFCRMGVRRKLGELCLDRDFCCLPESEPPQRRLCICNLVEGIGWVRELGKWLRFCFRKGNKRFDGPQGDWGGGAWDWGFNQLVCREQGQHITETQLLGTDCSADSGSSILEHREAGYSGSLIWPHHDTSTAFSCH